MTVAAVFLDRDGVLSIPNVVNNKPYAARSVGDFRLYPDLIVPLQRLKQAGFLLVVVTNQPDIANGLNTQAEVEAMHAIMCKALPIDHVEVCYHADRDDCSCRKPKPGMMLQAAERLGIDLSRSFMLGDQWRDIAAGDAAGCYTLLLDRGYDETLSVQPSTAVHSIIQAVDEILAIYYREASDGRTSTGSSV